MEKKTQYVYQFKITLQGIKPAIWRRIQVPQAYTFWDLHIAIQDAMGWEDCHLHQFELLNPKTGQVNLIGSPVAGGFLDTKVYPGWEKRISSYFSLSNKQASYEYDFGDDWQHKVLLEKILPFEAGLTYPRCIAGKRACPPEDCGGIWGYEEMLDIINDPEHEEYGERLEWLGGEFNPEEFNPQQVKFDDPRLHWQMAYGDEDEF
jgi:hypothetical protein